MTDSAIDRLESWKEIAAYLGRGVRTVRRWEAQEGLPVHRHMHRSLGSVYAFKSEIDRWRSAKRRGAADARRDTSTSSESVSIAVMPFANFSPDATDAYLADALTAEVIADLARVRALRVISRMSSLALRHTARGWKDAAAALGVRYILEGSVQRAGDHLRITAQLIDAHLDAHAWTDKFDGPLAQIFSIQELLARRVVEAMQVQLSAAEDHRLSQRPIADVHAYECYLRARHESWRWRKDAIDRAVQLLKQGLQIAPDSARLHAALGLTCLQYREAGIDSGPAPLAEAGACAEQVLRLAPESAEALQLRGWIHYSSCRLQEAVRDLAAAQRLEPNDPDTLLCLTNCYLISGQVQAARPLLQLLLDVDPLTPLTRCMPAWADILEGNFASALDPYRQMFEMDPGNPMARLFYVWVLALNRHTETAVGTARGFPVEARDTSAATVASLFADALEHGGLDPVSLETAERHALASTSDVLPRFLAQACALGGSRQAAVRWLALAAERGFINYPFLAHHDPFFASMRDSAELEPLLDEVRQRWNAFRLPSVTTAGAASR